MAAKRAPIAPILAFQATLLVILTFAVTGWAWYVNEFQRYEVNLPKEKLATARDHTYKAVIEPYAFIARSLVTEKVEAPSNGISISAEENGATAPSFSNAPSIDPTDPTLRTDLATPDSSFATNEDPAERSKSIMNASIDKARTALKDVGELIPTAQAKVISLTNEEFGAEQGQLNQLLEAASNVLNAPDTQKLKMGGLVEFLEQERNETEKSIAQVEAAVEENAAGFHQRAIQGLLGIWGAMLIVTLTATMLARRRAVDMETNQRGAIVKGLDRASKALRSIEPRERLPELVDHPDLKALNSDIQAISERFNYYLNFRDNVVRNQNFISDFVEALSVCERESHIVDAAQRAAKQAYQGCEFQYIRFDKDNREVVLELRTQEPACVLRTHTDCPAGRQGRALHNHSGAGVSRCPLIKAEDKCISCAPVFLNGEVSAIVQIIGYDEDVSGFGEFEALSMACSTRLGIIRADEGQMVQSNTDELTGLPNNRLVNERLNELDALNMNYGILVADLDHFRQINDEYGRETGDDCLRVFGQVLMRACRGSDMACRIAGETFVVLLPTANIRAGLAVSMRIRSYLQEATRETGIPFTVSIGVATKPDHGLGAQSVVRAANTAMQKAKEAGRNQVIPANVPEEQDRI